MSQRLFSLWMLFFFTFFQAKGQEYSVNYFGTKISFTVSEEYIKRTESIKLMNRPHGDFGFVYMYEYFDNSQQYLKLYNQLSSQKKKLKLDGWGFYQLTKLLAHEIFSSESSTLRRLFIWYVLTKKGYHVKIEYNADDLELYSRFNIPVESGNSYITNETYSCLNFKLEGYPFNLSYSHNPQKKSNVLDICLKSIPQKVLDSENSKEVKTTFEFRGKQYEYESSLNIDLITYLDSLPDIGFVKQRYDLLKAHNSLERLVSEIKRDISSFSFEDKVNFLISFTNRIFEYQEDEDFLGFEKNFFPEQLLYYGVGDCDDLSLFLGYLIKEALSEKAYILVYPSLKSGYTHVNVGIKVNAKYDGQHSSFTKWGKQYTYIVCEPTWDGNMIGEMIPIGIKGIEFEVVDIHKLF